MTDYARPAYADLLARIQTDLDALPATLRTVFATMLARGAHGLHGHLEWIDAQCSPLTCELERLHDWAGLYGVDRLLATSATGSVQATGVEGAAVLAGSLLRGANGLDYTVLAAGYIDAGSAVLQVRCLAAGSSGNQPAAATLALVDPVAGVDSSLVVGAGGLTGGSEEETLDLWRGRVAAAWRQITTYGAPAGRVEDYITWARAAHPSVTAALVQPHALGIGTVLVRPICDGLLDRLPTEAVLEAVAEKFAGVAPATADWRLAAPITRTVDWSLHLLPGYDTAGNRAAIESALRDLVGTETAVDAVLTRVEADYAVATVTTQYQWVVEPVDVAVEPGEVLVYGEVVWS